MTERIVAGICAFAVLVGALLLGGLGEDGGKATVKTKVTSTTTSTAATSSTTSTTEDPTTTTTTAPDDDSDDCKDAGTFGGLFTCNQPEPDDPDVDDNEKCTTILGHEICVPVDEGGDETPTEPPGTGSTASCESGEVTSAFRWFSQQEGKAAPNNFAVDPTALPADSVIDLSDSLARKQLLALMQYQSCLDPARLVADLVASDLVKTRDEAKLNDLVVKLRADTKLRKEWYRKLVNHRKGISKAYVWESNGKAFRTMDMLNNPNDKTYPQLKFTEGKGSCAHILVFVFNDGHTEVYCVECGLQPRWEIPPPEAPPATPVPQCTTCSTPPPTPCRRRCNPTNTTTTTRPPCTRNCNPTTTTTTRPHGTTTTTTAPCTWVVKDGRRVCVPNIGEP